MTRLTSRLTMSEYLDALVRDGRYALRRLLRDWTFTIAAILILGLGIGANTAIFSVVNAALLRQPTYGSLDRLVDIYQNGSNPGGMDANSYPAYLDMAAYTDLFTDTTAVLVPHGVTFQHDGVLRPAVVEHTTASYLSVLGLRPALGRWFSAGEDSRGAAVVAVVGHQTWRTKFRGDPSVIGRTIRMEGVPVTIVGVGPIGHSATLNLGIVTDFWLPVSSLPILGAPPSALERRPEEAAFLVKARLRDGVTVGQAQAAMRVLGARLASEYLKEDPGKGITVLSARDVHVHPQMDVFLRWIAFVLLGVFGLVLAIACSNLATLLLVRGAARTKEVSVRLALGATRGTLVKHLLMESMALSVTGGAAGCLLAWWTIRLLGAMDLPIVMDVALDYRVLAFALALSVATGLTFGLAPALKATRVDLVPGLRDEGDTRAAEQGRFTFRNALVVFQVAVSVALLGGAGLVLQMVRASRAQQPGFAIDGVAMLQTDTRYAGYTAAEARDVPENIRRRVAGIPSVQTAILTRGLPMQATGVSLVVESAAAGPVVRAGAIWAGPGFFEALRIPILHGRAIDERDRRDMPRVAVVSEAMAVEYFGTADAVGRRFRFEQDAGSWFEVVGVAVNTGTADLSGDLVDPTPQLFYRSVVQGDVMLDTIVARTSLDATALVTAMQNELRAVDPSLPVVSSATMARYLGESLLAPKAIATLLAGLAGLGLALAGVGLYAVVAFGVARRSREIGIRMALGAHGAHVVWTVTREVAALVGVGTSVGVAFSLMTVLALHAAVAPAPGISLYRPTADPKTLVVITMFMAAVGIAAASLPAWRAVRMDPLEALRHE